MTAFDEQKRGRRIAMTPAEVDEFLVTERTCRAATVKADGSPHVTPLWFLWHDGALWLTTLVRAQRWADLQRDPRMSVIVDAGEQYFELRGVELSGRVEVVGEVPRVGEPNPELGDIELRTAQKYQGPGAIVRTDGKHAWIRMRPDKIASWDFRKLSSL
jgi:hypothetical protein